MAMVIFEESGTFNPADYGLQIGDVLNIVCVGGGQCGGIGWYDSYYNPKDGGASSFGTFVDSSGGFLMGKGGKGVIVTSSYGYNPGSGAGGYIPGLPVFGGHGSSPGETAPATGLAGCVLRSQATVSPYCNPVGIGNKGAGCFLDGEDASLHNNDYPVNASGNGYGAGSSGFSTRTTTRKGSLNGGDSGKLAIGECILASLDPIPVTVGKGGSSSYTEYSTTYTVKGADGVVIVTW